MAGTLIHAFPAAYAYEPAAWAASLHKVHRVKVSAHTRPYNCSSNSIYGQQQNFVMVTEHGNRHPPAMKNGNCKKVSMQTRLLNQAASDITCALATHQLMLAICLQYSTSSLARQGFAGTMQSLTYQGIAKILNEVI